jgi:hypothetical protein
MIPAIVMYVYYGKVVGDVALLAAGVAPPRGAEYYTLLVIGLIATVAATTLITRSARKAIDDARRHRGAGRPGSPRGRRGGPSGPPVPSPPRS